MKIEELINSLGFGRFHKRLIVLSAIAAACTSLQGFIIVFLTFTPEYRCAIPGIENDTYIANGPLHQELINLTVPGGKTDHCERYVQSGVYDNDTAANFTAYYMNRGTLEKCKKWVYDRSVFTSSAVTEFNLVCSNSLQVAHGQVAYMVGLLAGSFIFGIIGDKFGRKKAALMCTFISLPMSIYMRWVPNFKAFIALRFFIGAFVIGNYANIYIIGIEYMEKSKRVLMATITDVIGVLASIVMVGMAYLVRDWRVLHYIFIPFLLLVSYVWLLPESMRWLLKNGEVESAKTLLFNIAKENRIQLPDGISKSVIEEEEKKENILKIFTSPVLLKRFVILGINWVGIVMAYYGLTLNSENLGGDFYLNILFSFAVELPAYMLFRILVNRIGRKFTFVSFALTCGICCIATLFPLLINRSGLQWLTVLLASIGKLGSTGAFQCLYMYSSELFPTTMRMSILGSLSCISRLGGITAPYIVELTKQIRGKFAVTVPLLIFGGYAIVSAMLCLMLPDTSKVTIPETVEDVKKNSQ